MNKYLKEYKWKDLKAMLENEKKSPKECLDSFKGRWLVISGATSGIGYHTVKEYAAHGANILCINRSEEKSQTICHEIQDEFGVECRYIIADFTHIANIHKIANELMHFEPSIDVFIHNAGIYNTKKVLTENGLEMVFQVNYLATFIINYLLKERFKQDKTRILYVNSEGHRFAITGIKLNDLRWEKHRYSGTKGYGTAKVAQLLSIIKFKEYFTDSGVTINAMHPGNVKTNMGNNNGKIYRLYKRLFIDSSTKSPEISATALYYLGVSKELEGISGKFFNLTTQEIPSPPALDEQEAEKLWDLSLELAGFK